MTQIMPFELLEPIYGWNDKAEQMEFLTVAQSFWNKLFFKLEERFTLILMSLTLVVLCFYQI